MATIHRTMTITDQGPALALELTEDDLTELGGKRVKVKVTINGATFRTTTAIMGGKRLIGINKANRTLTGVAPDDVVDVTIEHDTDERVIEVPAELAAAFRSDAAARTTWEGLSYSHQREYADWITGAKKADTRERRVAQALEKLAAGERSYR